MLTYKQAIVRIFNSENNIVGTGIAISNSQVLTCAHVVASAVGLPNAKAKGVNLDFFESDEIKIDFPTREESSTQTKVTFYLYEKNDPAHDIAILGQSDDSSFPTDLTPEKMLLPSSPDVSVGHVWEGQGYPKGAKGGLIAFGAITGQLATGLLQLDGTGTHTINVSPGFSGGGVYDRELEGVVGIFNLATNDDEKQTATAIPTATIQVKLAEKGIYLAVTSRGKPTVQVTSEEEQSIDTKELSKRMGEWLSLGNIKTACFDMGIEYEDLEGSTKTEKIQSLIKHCKQINKMELLISTLEEINPYRNWRI